MRVGFNISAVQLPFVGCVYSTTFPSFLPPMYEHLVILNHVLSLTLPQLFVMYSSVSPCSSVEVLSIVTIMDRVSTILADTILIIITWKRVMPDGVMNASRQFKITKIEGLGSVLLRDGSSAFIFHCSRPIVLRYPQFDRHALLRVSFQS